MTISVRRWPSVAAGGPGCSAPSANVPGRRPDWEQGLTYLTGREREVTRLVAQGLANDEIALALSISYTTAKTHVNRAMHKTGCSHRAQLVVLAYETGLVRPGGPR